VHGDETLTGGHEVSESGVDRMAGGADPSSVDEVGRPGVTGGRTPGEGTQNR
jgi:hypothetical protein